MDKKYNRRDAIRQIAVVMGGTATAIVLPSAWTKPVMDAVIGPAAAYFISYCGEDGTRHTTRGPFPNSPYCPQTSTLPPTTLPPTTLGPS